MMHLLQFPVIALTLLVASCVRLFVSATQLPVNSAFLSPVGTSADSLAIKDGTSFRSQFTSTTLSASSFSDSPPSSPPWLKNKLASVPNVPTDNGKTPSVLKSAWAKITGNPDKCSIFQSSKLSGLSAEQLWKVAEPFVLYYATLEGQKLTEPISFSNLMTTPIITDNMPCKAIIFTGNQIPSADIARSAGVLFQIMQKYRSDYVRIGKDDSRKKVAAAQVKAAILGFNQGRGEISSAQATIHLRKLLKNTPSIIENLSPTSFYDEVVTAIRSSPLKQAAPSKSAVDVGGRPTVGNRYGNTPISDIGKVYNCSIFTAEDVYRYDAKHLYHIVTPFVNYFMSEKGSAYIEHLDPFNAYDLPCKQVLLLKSVNSFTYAQKILEMYTSLETYQEEYIYQSDETTALNRDTFALKLKAMLLGFNVWRGAVSRGAANRLLKTMIPSYMPYDFYGATKDIYYYSLMST